VPNGPIDLTHYGIAQLRLNAFCGPGCAPWLASLLLPQCALCVCLAINVASGGPMGARLFPVPQRALGVGLGYNVGIIVFGAFAPFITEWLNQASGDKLMTA